MRKIEGYICLAKFEGHFPFTRFIGQNTGNGNASWESFNSNGMIPFVTLPEAARAQQELLAKPSSDLVEVTKGRIRWEMAENETDLANFTKRRLRSFIVVSLGDIYEFYGSLMEGLPTAYPLPGAHLSDNGLIAYQRLDNALWTAREIVRQGWIPALIAHYQLRRLK